MRILLIEEFDSAPVPQALQCENIAFDMVPPPEEDRELRRNFPQYVRALAEVYGVLNKL